MQTRLKNSLQTCGICYQKTISRGVLDSCAHIFCFQCIKSWAQIENTCPLCKVRFRTIEKQLLRKNYNEKRPRKVQGSSNQVIIRQRSQSESDLGSLASNFSVEQLTFALIQIVEFNPQLLQEFLMAERLSFGDLLQNYSNI